MRKTALKALLGLAAAAIGTALLASPAAARGGHSIPIPCLDEQVVKVLELPQTAAQREIFPGSRGLSRIDLGYKFTHCFWGEWVGFKSETGQHLALNDVQLKHMLAAAGLSEPPAAPFYLANPLRSWRVWFWAVILSVFVYRRWPLRLKNPSAGGSGYWSPEASAARRKAAEAIYGALTKSPGIVPAQEPTPAVDAEPAAPANIAPPAPVRKPSLPPPAAAFTPSRPPRTFGKRSAA